MPNEEIELKLLCPKDASVHLAQERLFADALERLERQLVTTYFDTPDQALGRAGISLRVREEDGRFIQSVKSAKSAVTRYEQEWTIAANEPDLAIIPRNGKLAVLADVGQSLMPIFQTQVTRRSADVRHASSLIEISHDLGWIIAGDRTARINEIELELKAGRLEDLFAVARNLVHESTLMIDLQSKSERGLCLFANTSQLVETIAAPAIPLKATFADGFHSLALACLQPFLTNARMFEESRAAEALHQTRTAARRIRALLQFFKRHLDHDACTRLRAEWKWLSQSLGTARDLDVACQNWRHQKQTAILAEALAPEREKAFEKAIDQLRSSRARLLLVDFTAWITCGAWMLRQERKITPESFTDILFKECARWDKSLRRDGDELDRRGAEKRHNLRIHAKSLFYVCELAAQVMQPKAHRRYTKRLKRFQSALGLENDARVASDILAVLDGRPELHKAIRQALRRGERTSHKAERAALVLFSGFQGAPRPWKA